MLVFIRCCGLLLCLFWLSGKTGLQDRKVPKKFTFKIDSTRFLEVFFYCSASFHTLVVIFCNVILTVHILGANKMQNLQKMKSLLRGFFVIC